MRVAFVAIGDPNDRRVWSGTPHYALREIRKRVGDVHVVSTDGIDLVLNRINRLTRKLGWDLSREPLVSRIYSTSIERELQRIKPDVVLSIGASNKVADLPGDWPIVHVSDALFETVTGYYVRYRRLSERSRTLGNRIQQRLIDRARAILLTSNWAKDGAEDFYDAREGLISVAAIGANLDRDPGGDVARIAKDRLRLLFVGIDWRRKGGTLMLETFDHVRALVPDAELHIVGCEPRLAVERPGVVIHGFLSKSDPEQRSTLEELYRSASMFLMLSHEEAFGLVYCEAAAYGLPSVALRTGGIPTIVRDGETGTLLPPDAGPQEIGERIVALWRDRPRYDAMRAAARHAYETRLNWTAWGDSVERALRLAAGEPSEESAGRPGAAGRRLQSDYGRSVHLKP